MSRIAPLVNELAGTESADDIMQEVLGVLTEGSAPETGNIYVFVYLFMQQSSWHLDLAKEEPVLAEFSAPSFTRICYECSKSTLNCLQKNLRFYTDTGKQFYRIFLSKKTDFFRSHFPTLSQSSYHQRSLCRVSPGSWTAPAVFAYFPLIRKEQLPSYT